MYRLVLFFLFMLCLVLAAGGQTKISKKKILEPSSEDLTEAKKQGFRVFKILPRGMFKDNELPPRGGGAYYSFVRKSHSYDDIPQIEYMQLVINRINNPRIESPKSVSVDFLQVGFYGANYGFIADLGEIPLAEITPESKTAKFLTSYKPDSGELSARYAYQRVREDFEVEGIKYSQTYAAVVGHTYILRAISFGEADTLVAFHLYRKAADGGLIIFWKLIKEFKVPYLKSSNKTLTQQ